MPGLTWTCLSRTFMLLAFVLAACSAGPVGNALNDSEPENSVVEDVARPISWPSGLKPFGDGYPKAGDPCRRVGESAATNDYLDDSADLIGCPDEALGSALGKVVGQVDNITLVSVPKGDANAGMEKRVSATVDPIRGKGGLEERCLARVADITRARVNGTNRIKESQAAIEIFVNVEGAQAPWRCLGNRDGTISQVEYTGSEGAL